MIDTSNLRSLNRWRMEWGTRYSRLRRVVWFWGIRAGCSGNARRARARKCNIPVTLARTSSTIQFNSSPNHLAADLPTHPLAH